MEARKAELKDQLANAEEPPPLLHPNMAEVYHHRISTLYGDLQNEETTAQAALTFRSLVDQIELVPEGKDLQIMLRGDLAAILRFAANKKNPGVLSDAGFWGALLSQEPMIAGFSIREGMRYSCARMSWWTAASQPGRGGARVGVLRWLTQKGRPFVWGRPFL
ncbi:hypothetical protein ACFQU1_08925 [Chelatococcus sp. GCM10030263]|uniref:hypothetical protein n=1 Tax=Chelatococcus sp. GCM10030263 TaxID=3273387 RepID=UPI00361D16E9